MVDVRKKTESAEKVKNEVQVVKDRAQVIVDKISVDKAFAERKLEAAKPAELAAMEALKVSKFNLNTELSQIHGTQFKGWNRTLTVICSNIVH